MLVSLISFAQLESLAAQLGAALKSRALVMATAESCTGGLVSSAITSVAGSSAWFDRGFVTYSNLAKHQMLGVPLALMEAHGAVSEEVARAMALGALTHSQAHIAVSITGIAGPDGGSAAKPVGTVWFGIAQRMSGHDAFEVNAQLQQFEGDRTTVRTKAAAHALHMLIAELQ